LKTILQRRRRSQLWAEKARTEEEQAAQRETERRRRVQAEEEASLPAAEKRAGAMQRKGSKAAVHSELSNIDITRFSGAMLARIVAARAVERDSLTGQQGKPASQ